MKPVIFESPEVLARNEFIEAHWSSVNVPMTSAIKDWLVLWMDVGSAC